MERHWPDTTYRRTEDVYFPSPLELKKILKQQSSFSTTQYNGQFGTQHPNTLIYSLPYPNKTKN
jgi:hypothetical protein